MPTPREPIYRWPDWLKPPLMDGYGVKPEDRRVRADFDIGSQFRIEFDTDETTASCQLWLEPIGANWLEAFERDLLVQGSRWFLMPLWVGGQMADHRVRFKARPEITEVRGHWSKYTFQLDVSRREGLMDRGLAELLLEIDPYEFMKFEDLLQIVVNEKYPRSLPFGRNYW